MRGPATTHSTPPPPNSTPAPSPWAPQPPVQATPASATPPPDPVAPQLEFLDELASGKKLLAFSHGSDSTALFYLLIEAGVEFDLALVNYKTRPASDAEEAAAKKLAAQYGKKIFTLAAPALKNNFEKQARDLRYGFFAQLGREEGYEKIILAHSLDDRFEWLLMQLGRGAGLAELLGFEGLSRRGEQLLIRPLIRTPKAEILAFLRARGLAYFKDESNEDGTFLRNRIRAKFAAPFLRDFARGVGRSFEFLEKDAAKLRGEIREEDGMLSCEIDESLIARALKIKGLLPSAGQRREMMRGDCVLSGPGGLRLGVVFTAGRAVIFEFKKCEGMSKKFRDHCRRERVPRLLRGYLWEKKMGPRNGGTGKDR